ncbi:MauE/DoxX family redox-associated membrane protein [Streptomyces sp. V3I7]|uniref:MauE/DoxX family redox-associated membrane protein n=1 Tax=Streptomyces sp. V3I7 TaxID=3042278 RepID=UPI002781EA86|nr:MauE/DoxX family redox-associated membrane protein [Streptomyces sp. V3I7]MDQ0989312.1 hypothetical protein [Streptomyces sp. V3I7]
MISLAWNLAPVAVGGLLAWTGAAKLRSRSLQRQAADTALARVLNDVQRAVLVLRAVGTLELLLAAGLLLLPAAAFPGWATAALGTGFLGYLAHAKATMPESSCGCSAKDDDRITWRSFARAGLVVLGGLAALASSTPWWSQAGRQPLASVAFLAAWAAVVTALSSEVERRLLMPVRRLRVRIFGHPLVAYGDQVPVAASVELLENSLAWEAASPVVRSALVDHWDDGGWRILRFTGVHGSGAKARPVSVLFALDASSSMDTTDNPAVRVTVVDDDTDEVVAADLLTGRPSRPALPLVT